MVQLMSNQTLSLSISPQETITDPYWINMEIMEDEYADGMTIGAAADIIDALYDIEVCDQDNPDVWNMGGTREPAEEPPTAEKFNDVIGAVAPGLADCRNIKSAEADPGSYDVKIKVYRSHEYEKYKLIVSNGTPGTPRRIDVEQVTETVHVENATHVTMDKPVGGIKNLAWIGASATPEIKQLGNTFYWEGKVTGTLRAEFGTYHDLINVHVHGQAGESSVITGSMPPEMFGEGWYSGSEDGSELTDIGNIQCSVLAFYHYQYEELQLNRPENDDSVTDDVRYGICSTTVIPWEGGTNSDFSSSECEAECSERCPDIPEEVCKSKCQEALTDCKDTEENCTKAYYDCITSCSGTTKDKDCVSSCSDACKRDCYQRSNDINLCLCSKDSTTDRERKVVACPEGVRTGSELEDEKETTNYVDCGEREEPYLPEVYEEKCCYPPAADLQALYYPKDERLPWCKTRTTAFVGGKEMDQETKDELKAQYENITFIGVAPPSTGCGEWTLEQVIKQHNCCDEVSPIVWDEENSVEVISDNSSGFVFVNGGRYPYTWTVRGSGFWLDAAHTKREITVDSSAVQIYTKDSCGGCTITVTDGCSTVSGIVRSSSGSWQVVSTGCKPEYAGREADTVFDFTVDPNNRHLVGFSYSSMHYVAQWFMICNFSDPSNEQCCWAGCIEERIYACGKFPELSDTPPANNFCFSINARDTLMDNDGAYTASCVNSYDAVLYKSDHWYENDKYVTWHFKPGNDGDCWFYSNPNVCRFGQAAKYYIGPPREYKWMC